MAEQFVNYKVELVLHDSSKIRGYVNGIKDKVLTITEAEFVGQDKTLDHFTISGDKINDLSVVDIPKEALVRNKKDSNNNNNSAKKNQQQQHTPSKSLIDDAILFQNPGSKVGTPKAQHKHLVSPKLQPQQSFVDDAILFAQPSKASSVANSPKVRKKKSILKNNKPKNQPQPQAQQQLQQHYGNETWVDDVAQIKDSQDFDFATNLALFDKATVFKDLKSKDKINYADRLAGHNKIESPAKKVNYDNNEMVLNGREDNWDNLGGASSSNTMDEEDEIEEGEQKMSQAVKKLDFSNQPQKPKKKFTILKRPEKLETNENTTPKKAPVASRPPIFSPVPQSDIKFSLSSGTTLSLCSPVQLLEIERLSSELFGANDQMFAENSGIGLSKLIIRTLGGSSRLSSNNHNKPPLVAILVGNNKAGARALAAGRHLSNRGLRVVAFVLSNDISDVVHESRASSTSSDSDIFYDAKEDFDTIVKDQLKLFVNYGGKVFNELHNLKKTIASLDSPLELVIDALQGYDTNLSDFWGEELKKCLGLIKWVNSSRAKVLSIDIASGLDAGSGQFSLTASDVEELALDVSPDDFRIKSNIVVSMGLPVIGLMHAYYLGVIEAGDWIHYLIDLGIPRKVYSSKGSLRKFDKTYFGDEWFSEVDVNHS
ncbi:Edc3 protein [Saccharomycopsis crataegensis]|uniref:Enhancer of mRNA-decapping protein 3 n=1 Tax=Saccharomycopsis crataegensis TaxID=43959 RepID=A0AAV5QHZ1_9ASCO|nr:Edc3 protein [Saccharomycopsis crataegensis]